MTIPTTPPSEGSGEPKPQSTVRMYATRASYHLTAAREILRLSPVASVAFVHPGDDPSSGHTSPVNGAPGFRPTKGQREETVMNEPLLAVVVPVDEDDEPGEDYDGWNVYFHTHRFSGLMEAIERGVTAITATATIIDGLVFSPTAHDHSLNYRSATLHLCQPKILSPTPEYLEEKRRALAAVVDVVTGYGRSAAIGPPDDPNTNRTSVVRCKIAAVSSKQRYGGWNYAKEPALGPDDESGETATEGFKGVVPCWTAWGAPMGYGRDTSEVEEVLRAREKEGKEFAHMSAWGNEGARLDGLGRRNKAK